MDEPITQETLVPDNDFVKIPCGECDRETRHKVLAETKTHWQDPEGYVDLWKQNQIVQCQGCLTISFCEASQFSEDMDYDPHTGQPFLPTTRKYFPNRIAGRPMIQEAHLLPHGVYSIYEEAHGALCATLSIMAGFGIRAIVEAVCTDKNIKGKNLQERIDGLAGDGLITSAGSTILHSLRFMGNAAAHEMRAHSQRELNAAFDVVEYLLRGVYVLPKQAESLPSNTANKAPKPTQ